MWLKHLKQRLTRTSERLTGGLGGLLGDGGADGGARFFDELETRLLGADVGAATSLAVIDNLKKRAGRGGARDLAALLELLRDEIAAVLAPCQLPDGGAPAAGAGGPFAVLVAGVNGVGKTTTIGKLGHHYKACGRSVMFAAGDTFRAAAIEQIEAWGRRCDIAVVSQAPGADSAAVIFDALASARAKGADILLADTAGRLHTDRNLMEELKKVKRAMARQDNAAPHEVLLVVDAGTGQNALSQTRAFHDALGVTGIVATKLDGTAKGGVLVAMAAEFGIPIRFIGVGEAAQDLRPFNAREYAGAMLGLDTPDAANTAESTTANTAASTAARE